MYLNRYFSEINREVGYNLIRRARRENTYTCIHARTHEHTPVRTHARTHARTQQTHSLTRTHARRHSTRAVQTNETDNCVGLRNKITDRICRDHHRKRSECPPVQKYRLPQGNMNPAAKTVRLHFYGVTH